jgi:hypothetical protein
MMIPSHPIPSKAEHLLCLMREALGRARQWETTSTDYATRWGTLAGTALELAIDVDAGAA